MADHSVPIEDLANVEPASLMPIDVNALAGPGASMHPPRILMLYGSLRARSYSRFASEEAARLLRWFGAETRTFNPSGLPLPDAVGPDHPKVRELRELATWAEGMVWCSPERHGAMTGVMKAQVDWLPLSLGPFLDIFMSDKRPSRRDQVRAHRQGIPPAARWPASRDRTAGS